ncbi:MAG: 2Fe-2S iron-sulfur cluster-binding protein [Alphaproteobacteria bacterium]|nr:2Fe-2S iron-sulfur cluster-binding protein [Alphaproteobacteria bacterium]
MASQPQDTELFYETQIFCCCNQRPEGHPRSCCADRGGREFMEAISKRVSDAGLDHVTVTEAGCMERCELGPTMVVYPDAVWYSFENESDIDEIVESHLKGGKPVDRLVLEPDQKLPKPKTVDLLDVTVAEIRDETADIRSVVLKPAGGGTMPAFEAGAHIDVMTGNGMRRSYSIASDPKDLSSYLLGILREPESRGGSVWIHDNLKPGDSLKITKPLNNFPLSADADKHLLIAGGIGVTPILAMARTLAAAGADFEFHYCTRTPEGTAFRGEVEAIAGDRLCYHHDGGDPSQGIKLDEVLGAQPPGTHVYVCGPKTLIDAVRAAAGEWPESRVHFELFSAAPDQDWKNEPFDIYLSRRRMELTVPADRTILEVIREAGVFADSSCEQGLCSTCQVRVISGEIEHRDQILSQEEKAAGDTMMICVSRGKGEDRLVLDI